VVLEWLYRPEYLVVPQSQLHVIEDDPADNRVLEAAIAGQAGAIVSGDRHLLALRQYESVSILTPAQFVTAHVRRLGQ
jgi:uncharacterized protein